MIKNGILENNTSIFVLTILIILLSYGCSKKQSSSFINILVFSKTEGYRHQSIEAGIQALENIAKANDFSITTTEDATVFKQASLAPFNVVVFLSTTGDILTTPQQFEFERWIQAGGGFVGIHAATDTEYNWPWYNELVGGYFAGHPPGVHEATMQVLDPDHPSTKHLDKIFTATDEWYNFKKLNPDTKKLLNLDESSYEGGTMGKAHPIAWYHEFSGGRAWYTGLGHTSEIFQEIDFLKHLQGGIEYAAGNHQLVNYELKSVAPEENRFEKVVLQENLNEPAELDFLPDGRILWIERKGKIHVYDPERNTAHISHHLPINDFSENGLIGLAVDPNYANNNFIYLHYSAPDAKVQRVSRFEFYPDEAFELKNEKEILTIPVQTDECCHTGGSMQFGKDRHLFISTGDNTNPFESSGYGPIDDRPGRSPFDARGSSANTMDLRGKILRIIIDEAGNYTTPPDNLFPDGKTGRPEIYVMGCRNPYRISIDKHTGYLYWGDVGPDAYEPNDLRGPAGHDEVNQARKAGFFGWPLFVGNNKPYYDYDFSTKKSGVLFDPLRPVNDSRNNTGAAILPPAQPAFIYYPYATSAEFPLMGTGGRNAMAGPVYYAADYPKSKHRLPDYYDGKLITYDWIRGIMMAVTMKENGDFESMQPFLPSMEFANPIDLELDRHGRLFMLEYGKGWFSRNLDARLVYLRYRDGNRPPIANIAVTQKYGAVPFTVQASGEKSVDYDREKLLYSWYYNGAQIGKGSSLNYTFQQPGEYRIKLKVTDQSGQTNETETTVYAGNSQPDVAVDIMGNKTFYWDNRDLNYKVNILDHEDGTLDAGIFPGAVTFTIDYLEEGFDQNISAMGHQEKVYSSAGEQLIDESNCLSCHQLNKASSGPSYQQVAERYARDTPTNVQHLMNKISNGGGGVWGEAAMPAHPDLNSTQLNQIVKYILALNDPPELNGLPPAGNFVLKKHLSKEKKQGQYLIQASYTDRGGELIGPLKNTDKIALRHHSLNANQSDVKTKGRYFQLSEKAFPGLKTPYDVVGIKHGENIGFQQIDLTGIGLLKIDGYFPEAVAPQGKAEVRSGTDILGSINLGKAQPNGNGGYYFEIPLQDFNGFTEVRLYYINHKNQEQELAIHRIGFTPKPLFASVK